MANGMEFNNYGGKEDFFNHSEGKVAPFVEKSGGPVDAFGDKEAKSKSEGPNMNAAGAFNAKDLSKVDVMGTDYAKKKYNQVETKDEHFKEGDVSPSGNDAAKGKSFQSSTRK